MTDLTTLAAVKLYSGITTDTDDDMLTALITAYSQWVRSYCSLNFTEDAFEIWRDGRGSDFMLLPQYPIVSVQLLEVDGKAISPQAVYGLPGYRFTENQLLLEGSVFCWGRQNVHVQFTAGYATVPADIAQAVNELIGLRYANRGNQGWTSKSLAGEVVSLNVKDMPASVRTVLDQYARKVPM